MKLGEITPAPEQILNEQVAESALHYPDRTHLLGIDPDSELHATTMAELNRIKKYNPRLYDKIMSLG